MSPANTGSDNEGDLPENLTRATPPSSGDYPAELDNPPQLKYRSPAAISLNADEYDSYLKRTRALS